MLFAMLGALMGTKAGHTGMFSARLCVIASKLVQES